MFEYFTDKSVKAVMLAQEETRRLGHNLVGTEQILLGLIAEGTGIAAKALSNSGVTLEAARKEVQKIIGRGTGYVPMDIPFTPKVKRVFELAFEEARQLGHNYIGPEHLLLGLIRTGEGVAIRVLENLGVDLSNLRTQVMGMLGEVAAVPAGGARASQASKNKTAKLDEFGTNLTQQALEGKLDPVVGREKEIERAIQILGRRTKNNPVLIGEPGVGKTAIAEGLAQRIADKNVPSLLEDKQVYSLDMGLLIAGTRFRGEFEERLKGIVDEIRKAGNIILVIDEIHTLIGTGAAEGGMDAANMLKPALARGELQCMGMTTLDEYRKHIERDAALERRFQPIMVGEPSVAETIEILFGLREVFEQHHKVKISDAALHAAATLSDRYISDRFLPDKAIDLIDEAGSRVRLKNTPASATKELKQELQKVTKEKEAAVKAQDFDSAGKLRDRELELEAEIKAIQNNSQRPSITPEVSEEDIAHIVASWTGVPVNKLTETESEVLLHLEDTLHQRVIGQDEAVKAVSRAIRRARVGLKSPNRPIASFIFSGPTGVGKTELAKALAAYMFDTEEALVRIDMSEYMEKHAVSRLIGAPPGYVGYEEGGQLTEAIRRRPYAVILFDEIEKAHPDVFNVLLQILDDGRVTDAQGHTVDFKNSVIIMTSNIGSQYILDIAGDDSRYEEMRSRVMEAMRNSFRPEFLNRVDETIIFHGLQKQELRRIVQLQVERLARRLSDRKISLKLSDAALDFLAEVGYDPVYGARPLKRAIQRELETQIAKAILRGEFNDGDTIFVDVENERLAFKRLPAELLTTQS